MSRLYHVNPDTRELGVCEASTPERCRFGQTFTKDEIPQYEAQIGAEFPSISKLDSSYTDSKTSKFAEDEFFLTKATAVRKFIGRTRKVGYEDALKELTEVEQILVIPTSESLAKPLEGIVVSNEEQKNIAVGDLVMLDGSNLIYEVTSSEINADEHKDECTLTPLVDRLGVDKIAPEVHLRANLKLITNYHIHDSKITSLSEDESFDKRGLRERARDDRRELAGRGIAERSRIKTEALKALSGPTPLNEAGIESFLTSMIAEQDSEMQALTLADPRSAFASAVDDLASSEKLSEPQLAYVIAYCRNQKRLTRVEPFRCTAVSRAFREMGSMRTEARFLESSLEELDTRRKSRVKREKKGFLKKLVNPGPTRAEMLLRADEQNFDLTMKKARSSTLRLWIEGEWDCDVAVSASASRAIREIENTYSSNPDLDIDKSVQLLRMMESEIPDILRQANPQKPNAAPPEKLLAQLDEIMKIVHSFTGSTADAQKNSLRKELDFVKSKLSGI